MSPQLVHLLARLTSLDAQLAHLLRRLCKRAVLGPANLPRLRDSAARRVGFPSSIQHLFSTHALTRRDDVVQTALNPHDSYKTSILSGLSPSVILDIASRALNFYTYQVSPLQRLSRAVSQAPLARRSSKKRCSRR